MSKRTGSGVTGNLSVVLQNGESPGGSDVVLHHTGTTRFLLPQRDDDAALRSLVASQRLQRAIGVNLPARHRTPEPLFRRPPDQAVRCRHTCLRHRRRKAVGRGPGVDRRRGAGNVSVRYLAI